MELLLNNTLFIVVSFIFSILMAWVIIPKIIVISRDKKMFDTPNSRSVHDKPIPRLGGVSFFPTIICSFCLSFVLRLKFGCPIADLNAVHLIAELLLLLSAITMLYLIGIADDLVGVGFKIKFLIQIISACLIPLSGIWINNFYGVFGLDELSPYFGIPFTIVLVVFITNAINLIDGIDGLASGLSSVALVILGIAFLEKQLWPYSMLAFSTLGVLIPFFRFNVFGNVDRAKKIFMGDTGSLTLGFILSFLAIKYTNYNASVASYTYGAIIIAFSALFIPAFDVIRVFFVRLKHGKSPFVADKSHIHHKFLDMGYSHRRVLCTILLLALVWSILNILLIPVLEPTYIILIDIICWGAICASWRVKKIFAKK